MLSKSFILASYFSYNTIELLSYTNIGSVLTATVKNKESNKTAIIDINYNDIPEVYYNAVNIYSAQIDLLTKTFNPKLELPEAVIRLILQTKIEETITKTNIRNNILRYTINYQEREVELTDSEKLYNELLLCKLLVEGYKIEEIKGSHFRFITLQKKETMTTTNNCSCYEFNSIRDCKHVRAAKVIRLNRRFIKEFIKY